MKGEPVRGPGFSYEMSLPGRDGMLGMIPAQYSKFTASKSNATAGLTVCDARPSRARMLESALAVPQATFGREWLHQTVPAMAAAYLFHLCQNHAFLDGNKRIGAKAALVVRFMNDEELNIQEAELASLVLDVASGVIGKKSLPISSKIGALPASILGRTVQR